jgi:hypothetical protein
MLTLNKSFFEEDQWGQFIDIEMQQLFPKQIIHYVTVERKTTTTVTTTTTSPPLKSILKKPIEIQTSVQNQEKNQNKKIIEEEEEKDYRFQEFIERQLYVGWLICALTFGFCLLP